MTVVSNAGIDLAHLRRVHLVGIGGMHMSAIAELLLARGVRVTGSDIAPSRFTRRLEDEGAVVYAGHAAANVGDVDLVVATVAIPEGNPELGAARARGIPVVIRAEMVAALMLGRTAVCIAGTHGKTTTSSLVAWALVQAGRKPSYLLGGDSIDLDHNAASGSGAEVVVEADEYAEAFLHYSPDVAIVTNVDVDHLDYYGTEERVLTAFAEFMARVRPNGALFVGIDSERLCGLLDGASTGIRSRIAATVQSFALDRAADWTARVLETSPEQHFDVLYHGAPFGRFTTRLAGRHNVANCLSAIAALHRLDISREDMQRSVASFRGARRRFELVAEMSGVTVMDDYAHHPTEVAATLAAARERFPRRRLVVVFQPHTFSRTQYLLEGFSSCFAAADALMLLQTYAARETATAGMDAHQLAEHIVPLRPPVADSAVEAVDWLRAQTRPGDVVFTMGAGSVDAVGRAFAEALQP